MYRTVSGSQLFLDDQALRGNLHYRVDVTELTQKCCRCWVCFFFRNIRNLRNLRNYYIVLYLNLVKRQEFPVRTYLAHSHFLWWTLAMSNRGAVFAT